MALIIGDCGFYQGNGDVGQKKDKGRIHYGFS